MQGRHKPIRTKPDHWVCLKAQNYAKLVILSLQRGPCLSLSLGVTPALRSDADASVPFPMLGCYHVPDTAPSASI